MVLLTYEHFQIQPYAILNETARHLGHTIMEEGARSWWLVRRREMAARSRELDQGFSYFFSWLNLTTSTPFYRYRGQT
jgi:hypothetical protein